MLLPLVVAQTLVLMLVAFADADAVRMCGQCLVLFRSPMDVHCQHYRWCWHLHFCVPIHLFDRCVSKCCCAIVVVGRLCCAENLPSEYPRMLMVFSHTVDNDSDSIVMEAVELGMELRLLSRLTDRNCHSGASVSSVYFHCSYLHMMGDNDVWIRWRLHVVAER